MVGAKGGSTSAASGPGAIAVVGRCVAADEVRVGMADKAQKTLSEMLFGFTIPPLLVIGCVASVIVVGRVFVWAMAWVLHFLDRIIPLP